MVKAVLAYRGPAVWRACERREYRLTLSTFPGADLTPRADLRLADSVAALLTAIDDLQPGLVRVVGHSIGGWLLPYAAAERQRVIELVYVAAVTLRRGERGIDMIPDERRPTYFDLAAASEDNSILGEFEPTWRRFFGSVDETTARSWYAQLTPQPFGPYLDPVAVGVGGYMPTRQWLRYPWSTPKRFTESASSELRLLTSHLPWITLIASAWSLCSC